MNWHQRLDILRWRSLEEADPGGNLLSGDKRREATARTRGELRASDDQALPMRAVDAFLQKRCDWLRTDAAGDKVRDVLKPMVVREARWSWVLAGWLLAFVVGFGLTGIGSEREINLLALPLVGLLLWNAVVMVASVVFEWMPRRHGTDAGRFSYLDFRGGDSQRRTPPAVHEETFCRYARPLERERNASRFRSWLHIAAAVLAMGSCVGMYAKGWSHEYRAVWESTLLKPQQAESFFSGLFWPASKATGLRVPVEAVPGMQRTGGVVVNSAEALTWIHLYAATLVLLVVVPRLLLAAWTERRSGGRVTEYWKTLGWDGYARRLLRVVEGGGEKVLALLHGVATDEAGKSRWMNAIREKLGGQSIMEFQVIDSGEEDEFAEAWTPASPLAVIVFQLATTPEEEVQRKLVSDLRSRLRARFADGKMIAIVDLAGVSGRWTAEHTESRRALWSRMLEGVADEMEFIGDETEMNRFRVPAPKTR